LTDLRPEQKHRIAGCKLQHGDRVFTYKTSIGCAVCKYQYYHTDTAGWMSQGEILEMAYGLISVLTTNTHENPFSDEDNWQASVARTLCFKLLNAAEADGMGGCKLCQS